MTLHQSQGGMGLEEGSWCPALEGLQAVSEEGRYGQEQTKSPL